MVGVVGVWCVCHPRSLVASSLPSSPRGEVRCCCVRSSRVRVWCVRPRDVCGRVWWCCACVASLVCVRLRVSVCVCACVVFPSVVCVLSRPVLVL